MAEAISMIFASLLFVQNVTGEGIVLEEDPYIEEGTCVLQLISLGIITLYWYLSNVYVISDTRIFLSFKPN